jgi:hypothetical protein
MTFWVFVMRIVAVENPQIALLKGLFMKFCLTYSSCKKENILNDFFKVAQECALIGAFDNEAEI